MMIFRYLSDCYNSTYNYFFNKNHEPFNKIPDELLLHIFSFLKPSQLANCQLTCKRWKLISDNEVLWKHQTEVPRYAFGKRKWTKYYGEVGKEPPLPDNIYQILRGPCPFVQGAQVWETHFLVMVPATLNNVEFNLDNFQEILSKNDHEQIFYKYSLPFDLFWNHIKILACNQSHWALVTKGVIPGSVSLNYEEQIKLLEKYDSYAPLNTVEAIVSICINNLYNRTLIFNGKITTRCSEQLYDNQTLVGYYKKNLKKSPIPHFSSLELFASNLVSKRIGIAAKRVLDC